MVTRTSSTVTLSDAEIHGLIACLEKALELLDEEEFRIRIGAPTQDARMLVATLQRIEPIRNGHPDTPPAR